MADISGLYGPPYAGRVGGGGGVILTGGGLGGKAIGFGSLDGSFIKVSLLAFFQNINVSSPTMSG